MTALGQARTAVIRPPEDQGDIERPVRVLLADDDPGERAALAAALAEDGCPVVPIASGHELLQELATSAQAAPPATRLDLVVCDLRAGGRRGLDVLLTLRQLSWTTPRILITTLQQRPRAAASMLGASLVFDGPDCAAELRAAVHHLARRG